MTITSGRARSASVTAWRTLAASAQTTMSSWAPRRALMPSRTTSWSVKAPRMRAMPMATSPTAMSLAKVGVNQVASPRNPSQSCQIP
jgi:hypothetical protein